MQPLYDHGNVCVGKMLRVVCARRYHSGKLTAFVDLDNDNCTLLCRLGHSPHLNILGLTQPPENELLIGNCFSPVIRSQCVSREFLGMCVVQGRRWIDREGIR